MLQCKVLHIGFKQLHKEYRLGNDCIVSSNVERDLGILVDNKLKFHEQCSAVVAKANKLLGMIRQSLNYSNAGMILCLYKSLVRSVMEHGNIIWGPYYVTDKQVIEKVQRRATKIIPNLRHYFYQQCLLKVSLPSLVYRQQRGEVIFLYQLTHQYYNINVTNLLQYQSSITRGHCYKIYKPHAWTFCYCKIHSNWDNLPARAVECSSIN